MNNIGWCDITRNYWAGCTKCSHGCQNCYAERFAIRLAAMGNEDYQRAIGPRSSGGNCWSGKIHLIEKSFQKPLPRKPCRIFVNSMTDTFHENVPFEWIDRVIEMIAATPRHKFMLLTKRAEEMAEYMKKAEARLMEKWTAQNMNICQ